MTGDNHHGDRTRAEILTAAAALFLDHGYEAVTIRMIATASKHATGAIYGHWSGGKEQIFRECAGRRPINDNLGTTLLEALRAYADGRQTGPTLAAAMVRAVEVGR